MKEVKMHTSSIFFFVNVDNPDSVALTKHAVLGEREETIFDQEKMQKFMQNFAIKMDIGNEANEVDVTNAHDYRTRLIHIVKNVHIFTKQWMWSILRF